MKNINDDGLKIIQPTRFILNVLLFAMLSFLLAYSFVWLFDGIDKYTQSHSHYLPARELGAAPIPSSTLMSSISIPSLTTALLMAFLTKLGMNIGDACWTAIKAGAKKLWNGDKHK